MKKAGTFIAWNTTTPTISATGGAKTTWRIIEGQTTPQLTAFLKTKDYINKKPYDGTADFGENKNVGTYKNEKNENSKTIPVTTHQVDGLAQGFDYVQDISVIEPKELLLVADKISIKKDGTVPSNFTGRITGFAPGESLGAGDTLKFALTEGETPTAVGFYGVKGTLKIGESNPAESGTYGTNYTFTNDPANASAFSIVVGVMPKLDFKGASPYVTIASTPDTMNIYSLQTNNVLKWMDFSIDKDGKVIFDTNNYLNYVTGHGRSEIDGTLTGGGNIYLINPNGMVFGSTAQVNVGNLYLSTRDLFTVNKLTDYETAVGALFQNDNAAIGDVTNLGKLNANGVVDSTTNTIEVEGKNISFKNIADVTKGGAITNGTLSGGSMHDNVKLTSHGGEIHLGFAVGEEVNTVNNTQYTNVTPPTLTGWTTDGTTYKYMLVRNAYELQNMKNILDGNYMLANDIEFKKTNGKYYITNFTPVGSYGNEPVDYLPYVFRGRLDGLNHVIKDIQIVKSGSNNYRTAYDVGIIGSNAGTVENLGVVNGSVDAKTNINGSWVGGIVGANKKEGTIRNVYFSGTVKGTNSVGGIAGGQNAGGIIENAYNKGEIIGYQTVGGIVGTNLGGVRSSDSSLFGTVRNTYNSGTVSASDLYSGGIAGQNAGNIENVYSDANASISGKSYVGGIVGRNYTYDTYTGKIVSAYNAGSVSGTGNYIGGIVGDGISGEVTNSYFSNGYYDENGVKQTKTQDLNLKSKNTFSLWGDDISAAGGAGTVWRIYDGQTTPLLTAFLKTKDVITETEYDGSLQPFDAELVTGDDHIISTVTGETGYAKQTNAGKYDGLAGGNVLYSDQLGYDLVDTKLIIQPKRLTVTFGSNTYNGIAVFTGVSGTLTGVVDGDVGKVSVTATATYVDKNVGEGKAVTYSNITLDGDKKDNYIVVDELTVSAK